MARRLKINVSGTRGGAAAVAGKTMKVRTVKRKRVTVAGVAAEAEAPRLEETPARVHEKRQAVIDVMPDTPAGEATGNAPVVEQPRPVRPHAVRPVADSGADQGLRPVGQPAVGGLRKTSDAAVPVRPHQPTRFKVTRPKLNWS